jgi:hypothetical protein
MSSSFQDKTILTEYEDVFQNVMALYAALQNEPRPRSIRRATLNQAGEVAAESTDFIADVEIKTKRILNPTQYRLVLRFAREDKYNSVPKILQQALGAVFLNSSLNYDGDYRVLYYRAKNNQLQDRSEPVHFVEETNE